MRKTIVAISNGTELRTYAPYVYNGSEWVKVFPKVYDGGWKDIGGTGFLMWNFLEHTGLYYNSTENIMVREPLTTNRFITQDNKRYTVKAVVTSETKPDMPITIKTFHGGNLLASTLDKLKDSNGRMLVVNN